MSFQVIGNSLKEGFSAKVAAKHSDNGASLQITDVVEDLVDVERISNGHLDRVRCTQ